MVKLKIRFLDLKNIIFDFKYNIITNDAVSI